MPIHSPAIDLERARHAILQRLRDLRRERGWTQAELAEKLGLSQARLSVIERGGGSITAEQFVVLLALTNVPIEQFLPRQSQEDEVQNALARLGALHLRELEDIVPTERFRRVEDAVIETLAAPRSARLVLALGPVLVWNVDHVRLDHISERLAGIGLSDRVGWLAETIAEGLGTLGRLPNGVWTRRARRAAFVFDEFVRRAKPGRRHDASEAGTPRDHLDPNVRSAKTLAELWRATGPVGRAWGIATELGPEDFAETIRTAAAHD